MVIFCISREISKYYVTYSQNFLYPRTFQNIVLLTDAFLTHILTVSLNKPTKIKILMIRKYNFATTQAMSEDFISSKVDE
jgi:hypothetical protein